MENAFSSLPQNLNFTLHCVHIHLSICLAPMNIGLLTLGLEKKYMMPAGVKSNYPLNMKKT